MSTINSETDTIAACATPSGEGALAIIRISGSETSNIIKSCFKPKTRPPVKYNYMTLGHLIDPVTGSIIDEVFCVQYRAHHSYTCEDSAEFFCHGSPIIVGAALEMLRRMGARPAEPGEFTRRAFLNGRIDLTSAEAVCALIRSQTDRAARIAFRQMEGALRRQIEGVKQNIIAISAEIESRLDFPEEELGEANRPRLIDAIENVRQTIKSQIEQGMRSRIFQKGARVVLVGHPNTGKSSLFNALLRAERAIVTPHPGTTRDSIEATVDLRGCPVTFVDTAGIRESAGEVEQLGIERAKAEMHRADLLLFILDNSLPLFEEDRFIYRNLPSVPYVIVLNKIDLPAQLCIEKEPMFEAAIPIARVSALTGKGLEDLEGIICGALRAEPANEEDALIINERHQSLLERARDFLKRAADAFRNGVPDELAMMDMREAHKAIADIIGDEIDEEVLDQIFSRFCIGK